MLVRNDDGIVIDWLGQPSGGFVDNSAAASQPVSLDLKIAGVSDFNGDGRSDVLFEMVDGTLQTWVGAADGSVLSPMEKVWQDAIANAGEFVDEIASHLVPRSPNTGSSGPPPLNGYAVCQKIRASHPDNGYRRAR